MILKGVHILVGLVCVLALTAATARATGGTPAKIIFSIEHLGEVPANCGLDFGLGFDMLSPGGELLGTGQTCLKSIDGCDPFELWVPGCHRTVAAVLYFDFANGSLVTPMRVLEVFTTPTSVVQRATGMIASGTGAFAGATGMVEGGGSAAFTDTGLTTHLVYTVHLHP
jgi:hypothetical protein